MIAVTEQGYRIAGVTSDGRHVLSNQRHTVPMPSCRPCSRSWSERFTDGLPARCLVDSVLLIRDLSDHLYKLIVKCHSAVEIVSFGETIPTDETIAGYSAFRSNPHGQ